MDSTKSPAEAPESGRTNFIRAIIDEDLAAGRAQQVVTRFPPEPNGYLHIGHAKSICLNFGLARAYQGVCHLRFDDTNPVKEDTEYVDSIQNDVRWLGFDWDDKLFFASDYFEKLYEIAEYLIQHGKAYVDASTLDEIRQGRGTLTEPGTPSPWRDRPAAESLALFRQMRASAFEDGTLVLRARIDMASPNMLMRDPILYRIRHAHHHRTGDAWCIYPMYDYAHPLSDAIESITHSICTLEFENNREFYDWVVAEAAPLLPAVPHQHEFARLNLAYTMMSKRKLLQLVQEDLVDGWDDPRMPTIAGLRRRGYTPEAIRDFADMIGVAKANSLVDFEKLEYCIRNDLNFRAPRVMAVLDPLEVTLTNWPAGHVELLEAASFPPDVGKPGTRTVPLSGTLYMERDDFLEDPPSDYYRLSPGKEVRLRHGYIIRCDEVVKDADGAITGLRCSYDPDRTGGGRKVKGVVHWVSAEHGKPAEFRLYDRLFVTERPGESGRDFREELNPESLVVKHGFIEPSVLDDDTDTRYQFTRQGYFAPDLDSTPDALVFNRVVALRDSFARANAQPAAVVLEAPVEEAPADDARKRPTRKSRAELRAEARAENPALAARMARYTDTLGLSPDDADVLTGDLPVGDFLEAALATYDNVPSVAKWVVNELLRELKDAPIDALPVAPAHLAALARLVDAGSISSSAGKTIFAEMALSGGAPEAIADRLGLRQVSDASAILPFIEQVMAANPDKVRAWREGKTALLGFFMGQVMRLSGGSADPGLTKQLVTEKLAG